MSSLFPSLYDLAMQPLEKRKFQKIRSEILNMADGRVLEIGAGTGINFPLYQKADRVDAIEPNQAMIEKSLSRKMQLQFLFTFTGSLLKNLNLLTIHLIQQLPLWCYAQSQILNKHSQRSNESASHRQKYYSLNM